MDDVGSVSLALLIAIPIRVPPHFLRILFAGYVLIRWSVLVQAHTRATGKSSVDRRAVNSSYMWRENAYQIFLILFGTEGTGRMLQPSSSKQKQT